MTKKLTHKEAEVAIRKAAEEGNITYAETDNIDDYEDIAREFLGNILGLDYDGCFISDESSLSDFSSCGMDDIEIPDDLELSDIYNIWDGYIVKKIEAAYGIVVSRSDNLVDIFEQIRQTKLRMRS